jgi:hypothetical protein
VTDRTCVSEYSSCSWRLLIAAALVSVVAGRDLFAATGHSAVPASGK